MIMLKIAGYLVGAIVAVFFAYVLGLTLYYIFKYTAKEIKKGGADDDRSNKP